MRRSVSEARARNGVPPLPVLYQFVTNESATDQSATDAAATAAGTSHEWSEMHSPVTDDESDEEGTTPPSFISSTTFSSLVWADAHGRHIFHSSMIRGVVGATVTPLWATS